MRMKFISIVFLWLIGNLLVSFPGGKAHGEVDMKRGETMNSESVVLGGGCFWCVEAIFQRVEGVSEVLPGYAGGTAETANDKEVSSGTTQHAEVIELTFDRTKVPLRDILRIFFHVHDPTTKNRQGNDHGPQYRSVIFFSTPEQKNVAKQVLAQIEKEKLWSDPIVTEIEALQKFYPAEQYHRDYYNRNRNQPYCSIVIGPKIAKLRKEFPEMYRED